MSEQPPRDPAAFGASLRARVRNAARASGRPASELEREYLLQRFLARVFHDENTDWVLKGGTGLLARLPGARHSQDIDLLHTTLDVEQALQELRQMAAVDAGDPFHFQLGAPRRMLGGVVGIRVPVTAYLGVKVAGRFPIDLATALTLVADVERRTVAPVIEVPGVAPLPPFTLYPLTDQVADKVCAMYERHGPDQIPSSRYRDLVDLVLVVTHFDLDAALIRTALRQESQRRGLQLPTSMTAPGPQWAREFPRTAATTMVPTALHPLQAALTATGACLNPLLTGTRLTGHWSTDTGAWIERSPELPEPSHPPPPTA